MKAHVFCLCVLLLATSPVLAQPASRESDDELDKKIKVLRDQLDDLLKEQQARYLAHWQADRKNHSFKVELGGTLECSGWSGERDAVHVSTLEVREPIKMHWPPNKFDFNKTPVVVDSGLVKLQFSSQKELIAVAGKNPFKELVIPVVVRGTLNASLPWTVSVESIKPKEREPLGDFAKAQIRGMLEKSPAPGFVRVNDKNWKLNFADNKDLIALAKKHSGQAVTITGAIKKPGIEDFWPANANLNPMYVYLGKTPFPADGNYVEKSLIINVESLNAAGK